MHSLQKVLPCINKFLRTCNIVEINDSNFEDGTDVTQAVKSLCADLNEICNTETAEPERDSDSGVTQITASDKELRERIRAFMKYSQSKIDEQNVKEFCSTTQPKQEWGCARTNLTYKRRSPHTMHIKVTKVVNSDGPQLKFTSSDNCTQSEVGRVGRERCKQSSPVEERLQNIESHLKIDSSKKTAFQQSTGNFPNLNSDQGSDIYVRLKKLEERLLAMEGSSPEYNFSHIDPVMTRQMSREKDLEDYSLEDIDDRIRQLKQSLLAKRRKMDGELSAT